MFLDIDSPFTMVVLIVAIAVGAGVINNWIKLRQQESNATDPGEMDSMQREISALKDRVRTLEKIVTDQDAQLKREIERL